MSLDNWDDLKFVLAMYRHGTMSAAARHLDTNVATVSRRIDRLSQALSVSLFEKRGGAFVATPAAERLARLAESLDQALRGEISSIHAGDSGTAISIEIAAPPAVQSHFILPRTRELAERLPHVMLTLSEKTFAQGLGGADIQIRIGRPDGGRLRARKIRDFSMRIYHGADHRLDGAWIGLSNRYPDADLLRALHPEADPKPRYRVEEIPTALEMARTTGLPALLPDFMILPEHGLIPADLHGNRIGGELWITYHETRHGDPTLRALVEWLCDTTGGGAATKGD